MRPAESVIDRLAGLRPARRVGSAAERALLDDVREQVAFDLAHPARVPLRWRLAEVDLVPGARTMATLVFAGPRRRAFRLTQRVPTVSLMEEAELLGHASHAVGYRGGTYLVFGGAWAAGEPVDGWHWHRTRRVVAWERGGAICELEEVIGNGIGLRGALRVAHGTRAAPAVRLGVAPAGRSSGGRVLT
jgi:hypothetical protein